jgi:hypothetical protein
MNDSGRPLWKQSQAEHNDCLQLGTHSLIYCGGSSQLTTHEVKLSNKGETRLGTPTVVDMEYEVDDDHYEVCGLVAAS